MKKILLPLLLFLFPFFLQGQKGWSLGVDVVFQHTGFTSWTNYQPFNHIAIRPAIGVYADYHFKEWIGVRSGLRLHFYTQKREQFSNNFTYLVLPVHIQFNGSIMNKNSGEIKNVVPTGYIGFNTLLLTKAVHKTNEGKENMEDYTGRIHYEFEAGLGVKVKLNNDLLLENLVIAAFGDPVNPAEYNSTQGAIVNMNLGFKASLLYWLDSSN